jgi:transcriptional regulator with XRE-family HTH domain
VERIVSFGYWVHRRRKALDLTQATLAQQVGCSLVTIRKIEGDERRPSRQIAELLADRLDIPEAERDDFLRMARGEFVAAMPSPLEAVPSAIFLQERDASPARADTFFVAREAELAQLDGYLDLALAGQPAPGQSVGPGGRVAFVLGGAGRGKTALVQEFTRRAQARQADLVAAGGNCNAYSGVGDPYLPFREILGLLTGDVEARWAAGAMSQAQAQRLWDLIPAAVRHEALFDNTRTGKPTGKET